MRPTMNNQAAVRRLMLRTIILDGGLIELRCLHPLRAGRIVQEWRSDPGIACRRASELAGTHDVYVGVLPRFERSGGKDALLLGRLVWADLDTLEAVRALREFRPSPTLVLRSGGVDRGVAKLHAWWILNERWKPDAIEHANRRIAHQLGSDAAVCDATRVMRLPGTLNHKSTPPAPVLCVWQGPRTTMNAVAGGLPDPMPPRAPRPPRAINADDDLASIPAEAYIPALCGREVGRNRKVRCPLHADGEERTPSLHVYDDDRGWFCHACRLGGDIYSFAAALWRMDPRREFPALRDRLRSELLGTRAA